MKWPEETISSNLSNVCRLCMAEGTECMQQIFAECEHDGERFQLSSRILAVTSLKMEPGDQMPEQACQDCVAQVNRWYDFKVLCESSDSMLRQQLSNSSSEVEIIMDFSTVGESLHPGLVFNGDSISNQQMEPMANGFSSSLPFLCTLCEARFSRKSLLKQHIAAHCGEPPHSCNRCGEGFILKSELVKHMNAHTPPPRLYRRVHRTNYPCAVCHFRFKHPQSLLHHQANHSNPCRLQCVFCSRICTSSVQLRFHLRQHVKHRRFCISCKLSFTSLALLQQHECQIVEKISPPLMSPV